MLELLNICLYTSFMLKKFLNQQGFSILQAMMFAAIMAAGALVMTRTITDLKLSQKGAEARDDLEIFHASIVSALQDSNHCTATHTYNRTNPPAKQIKLAGTPSDPSLGEVLAEENQIYMNNSIKVKRIEYKEVTSPNGSITIIYSKLKPDERLKQGFGGKDIRKVVPVNFISDSSGFSRCYLDENTYNSQTAQEFCASLGNFMVWDPNNKKCSLKSHNCSSESGTVFVGIDSTGKEICQKITDAMVTKDIFDLGTVNCPVRTHIGLTVSGGKIVIVCNPGASACTPTTPCSAITPTYCPADPIQNDSCGVSCGAGTKSSGCTACTPSTWSAWSSTYTCISGFMSQTRTCNMGTCGTPCSGPNYMQDGSQPCGSACTPAIPCSTIVASYCATNPEQFDSCGNACGPGTQMPNCPPSGAVCAGCVFTGFDSCGGTCNVAGTSTMPDPQCFRPNGCVGSLPDGTKCGCTYPKTCAECLNPPLNICSPTLQGVCGQSISCSPEPSCP